MGGGALIYLVAAIMFAAVLAWSVIATLSVRTWVRHSREVEKTIAELPRMQPVLASLPRFPEHHRVVAAIVELRPHRNLVPAIRKVREVRIRRELQDQVSRIEFEVRPGKMLRLEASAGAAVFPYDGRTYEALLAEADHAMYRDKAARRRRVTRTTRGPSSRRRGPRE